MRKKVEAWQPPPDLDPECLALCVAMNKLPGIQTTDSCCGHGDQPNYKPKAMAALWQPHPYWIFFAIDKPESMLPLLYWMQWCHTPVKGKWHVHAYTDCAGDKVFWMLEGPIGNVAYEDALLIAAQLEREVT